MAALTDAFDDYNDDDDDDYNDDDDDDDNDDDDDEDNNNDYDDDNDGDDGPGNYEWPLSLPPLYHDDHNVYFCLFITMKIGKYYAFCKNVHTFVWRSLWHILAGDENPLIDVVSNPTEWR